MALVSNKIYKLICILFISILISACIHRSNVCKPEALQIGKDEHTIPYYVLPYQKGKWECSVCGYVFDSNDPKTNAIIIHSMDGKTTIHCPECYGQLIRKQTPELKAK